MARPRGTGALGAPGGVVLVVCALIGLGAGPAPEARIGGRVFEDRNGDGVRGADEAAAAGLTVEVFDCAARPALLRAVATTDASGVWAAEGLAPGWYAARLRWSAGTVRTRRSAPPAPGAEDGAPGAEDAATDADRPGQGAVLPRADGWSPCYRVAATEGLTLESGLQAYNRPPTCGRARADVEVVWPASRSYVHVTVLGVEDPDGDPVSVQIRAVYQDEPTGLTGDGAPDAVRLGGRLVALRAVRDEAGDGRVYHVRFRAGDGHGGVCDGEVTVSVPVRLTEAAVDEGPAHDATTPWDARWGPAPEAPPLDAIAPALAAHDEGR